jgi:hypothetical protein
MKDINNLMNVKNRQEYLRAQIIAAIVLAKCGKTIMGFYIILWN